MDVKVMEHELYKKQIRVMYCNESFHWLEHVEDILREVRELQQNFSEIQKVELKLMKNLRREMDRDDNLEERLKLLNRSFEKLHKTKDQLKKAMDKHEAYAA